MYKIGNIDSYLLELCVEININISQLIELNIVWSLYVRILHYININNFVYYE